MLANSIQEHKATPAYQEHTRKSGTQKNKFQGSTDGWTWALEDMVYTRAM